MTASNFDPSNFKSGGNSKLESVFFPATFIRINSNTTYNRPPRLLPALLEKTRSGLELNCNRSEPKNEVVLHFPNSDLGSDLLVYFNENKQNSSSLPRSSSNLFPLRPFQRPIQKSFTFFSGQTAQYTQGEVIEAIRLNKLAI